MSIGVTHKLFLCLQDLSVTSGLVWQDISSYLIEAPEVPMGVNIDGQQHRAAVATFRLRDPDRRFEPDYVASPYYPDIVPLRRIHYQIQDGAGPTYDVFYGFVQDWGPTWPDAGLAQEAVITAVDGSVILGLDKLPFLDPPDAASYSDVVEFDKPFGYWRLGETKGAKAVAQVGSDGVYKNTPLKGEAGALLGDSDTAVRFRSSQNEYMGAPVEIEHFADENALTAECWYKPAAFAGLSHPLIVGPRQGTVPIFELRVSAAGKLGLEVNGSDVAEGGTTLSAGTWYHLAGVWDDSRAFVYVNGALDGQSTGFVQIDTPTAGERLRVGFNQLASEYADGTLDEVAVYERGLTAERLTAHYQAGAQRGFPLQTAGARISAIAASDLWSESKIQAGDFDVLPTMQHGQVKLHEIADALAAELPDGLFYFDGVGDPVYLGWEYRATAPYNTPQVVIGDGAGEVAYEAAEIVYDEEIFNEVTHALEDGPAYTVFDQPSIDRYRGRLHPDSGVVPLVDDYDLRWRSQKELDQSKEPTIRLASITLNGLDPAARTQILTRMPGDLIRFKKRPKDGTPIDIVTWILGREIRATEDGNLKCVWRTARGANAGEGTWLLGIEGFSNLGSSTILA